MNGLVLGIETSIKNGSVSLLDGTREIDGWAGNKEVSRSEDLLPQIKLILERNNLDLKQIKKIAVSTGPGSFTGLRVGIATAKALGFAASCEVSGISLLEAMASSNHNNTKKETFAVAVSAGRGLFFWQIFSPETMEIMIEPALKTGNREYLTNGLKNEEIAEVLMESLAYADYLEGETRQEREFGIFEIREENLARLIALHALQNKQTENNISPLYVRPAVVSQKAQN